MTAAEVIREEALTISLILVCIVLAIVSAVYSDLWFLAFIPIIGCGIPIAKEVVTDAMHKEISAESLVMMAIIGCVILGEYFAAAEVAIIMAIGELLEDTVTSHAKSGIEALGKLETDRANLVTSGVMKEVPVTEIGPGDIIRILPGDIVPLDGIIISGRTSFDKSAITGESMPADACEGDEVFAGTSNMYGSVDVRVTKVSSESTVARMKELLKNADAGKSRIANAADRWAKWILLGAAVITILIYIGTKDVYRALTIMVVFCPCAFVLATPTAVMASAGNMARNGILLRDTSAIEGLARTDTVVFDKTGTLTTGHIVSLGYTNVSSDIPKDEVERMVAILESRSEHPLGRAIAESCPAEGTADDFDYIPGQGVSGKVDGHVIHAGNRLMMERCCPEGLGDVLKASEDSVHAIVYVGIDGRTTGFISLEDRIRDDSAPMMKELRDMGIRTVMLTGDSRKVAEEVSGRLGLDETVWECLPETKLGNIEKLEENGRVCMIGDGMNDAPALKRSTVGISMGAIGNDLAVGSSDLIFMNDDIGRLPGLIRLGRRAIKTIYCGLTLSMTINIIGVILAAIGEIGPALGAIIHNGGSFFVILLAASLLWCNPWGKR